MNTITLSNTSGAELGAMVSQLLKSDDVANVAVGKATTGENGVQMTSLSVTLTNGKVVNVNVETPDLDGATGEAYDTADYNALCTAIVSLSNDVAAVSQTKGGGAFCDLYAVMALLYEAAQKQRETTLQSRAAEHAATQSSLESQAAEARTTAEEAYASAHSAAVAQIVTSCISFVASSVSLGMQIGSFNSAEVKSARADYGQAKTDLAEVKAWPKPDVDVDANAQPRNVPVQNDQVKAIMNEVEPDAAANGNAGASKSLANASREYTEAQGAVEARKSDLATADTKVTQAQTKVNDLKARLDGADDAQKPDIQRQLDSAKTDLSDKIDARDAKKAELNKAKITCGDKARAYGAKLDATLAKAKDANLSDAQRSQLQQFADKSKQNMRADAMEGLGVRVETTRSNYDAAFRRELGSKWQLSAKGLDLTSQMTKMAGDTTSGAYNAESQYTTGKGQAQQKTREAEQEGYRTQTESLSDLAQSELDLLKFINQLLQNINQAEGDAVQAAIRA